MRERSIDLVIFDCDGVLIDSEVISARILIEQLGRVGVHVDFPYVQKHFLGRSWTKVAAEVRINYGLDLDSDFEERYRADLLAAFEMELSAVSGVKEVIDALNTRFCVATSSSPKRARRSLYLSGLESRFGDRLFTASQVANGKPAPDLFLLAAEAMGVAPDRCLVVEDSMPGVLAAQAAGMEVWRFVGGSHLEGVPRNELDRDGALTIFDKWAQFFEMAPELKNPNRAVTATHG
ncbi:HAD family hydrolase [Oricola thermophila]|uniref:HAD family hydrolase n=1 Tax=Oricola thermophila TaxID=2742145 RepID=A0A6N1VEQ3_9HYPH|nr:HAD family hydrolase [Oricola thermophila]QKV19168.1 HAD family hydrolase [Oricola thermophila]